MVKFLALICATSLSACAAGPSPSSADVAKYGPRPSADQAKAAALAYVQNRKFKDPELREIAVEMPDELFCPFGVPGFWRYGWAVVFQVNFKNSSGAYAGYVTRRVLLTRGAWIGCPAASLNLSQPVNAL
jgi:hypothetical protein